jgi:hypothetical protein
MEKSYLSFSLDFDGKCEDVDTYQIDGVDTTDDVSYESVDKFVEEGLMSIDEFFVSEHRTEVQVWWNEDGTMDVHFRYFNEPEDGEFDDNELNGIEPIEFVNETEE